MRLSPDQERAHDVLLDRVLRGERLTKLAGFAGTGKTTLGRAFRERHWDRLEIRGACPTGKASDQQQKASGIPSTTLHRLFWRGAQGVGADGDLLWGDVDVSHMNDQLSSGDRGKRQVLWIDEGGMIPISIAKKIMAAVPPHICIIVSGDPFQLQPIREIAGFDLANPDAMLDTPHRQALGSPIIRLATWVRTELRLPDGGDFQKFGLPYIAAPLTAICEAVARRRGEDSAVVVNTHLARRLLNRGVRYYLDLPPREAGPAPGELLLIRRNCRELGLFNGSTARVVRTQKLQDDALASGYFLVDFEGVDGSAWLPERSWVDDEKLSFAENQAIVDDLVETNNYGGMKRLIEAAPGYAGTCHAFQGSQFERVFILDEGNRDIHWWYTAITRASDHLVCGRIQGWKRVRERERERAARAALERGDVNPAFGVGSVII